MSLSVPLHEIFSPNGKLDLDASCELVVHCRFGRHDVFRIHAKCVPVADEIIDSVEVFLELTFVSPGRPCMQIQTIYDIV
eukprot:scaffold29387_cov84-Amphora_coffeaeformis.AAC.1